MLFTSLFYHSAWCTYFHKVHYFARYIGRMRRTRMQTGGFVKKPTSVLSTCFLSWQVKDGTVWLTLQTLSVLFLVELLHVLSSPFEWKAKNTCFLSWERCEASMYQEVEEALTYMGYQPHTVTDQGMVPWPDRCSIASTDNSRPLLKRDIMQFISTLTFNQSCLSLMECRSPGLDYIEWRGDDFRFGRSSMWKICHFRFRTLQKWRGGWGTMQMIWATKRKGCASFKSNQANEPIFYRSPAFHTVIVIPSSYDLSPPTVRLVT